ncbi:bone morphogenetic protein 4-like [Dermacentor variabilis]|uniref:bone morphogenetic protein 4-like n=1 Tax=Dermacentor variabilis TaxID=34621 RepID=UPI003F5CA1A5
MLCPVLAVSWALLVAAVLPSGCRARAATGGGGDDPERARAIELIKGRILADLGLSSAPTGHGRAASNKLHLDHMMRVYRRSLHRSPEEGGGRSRGRGRKGLARGAAKEVTHYYSFKSEGKALQMARKGRASLQHFLFPIHIASGRSRGANATARSYSVRYARLRLRMMSRRPTLVRIYQLLEPGCPSCERRLINIRRLSRKGRHRMDVAEAVQSWVDQPESNHGLDIECKPACRLSRDSALDVEVAEVLNRSHRSYRNGPAGVLLQHHRAIDCSHGPDNQTDLCCRHSLKVSFAEIGWHWVAEPKEFDAYMCKGRCPNDNRNFNSTHALVQSLMSERADVPSPCCAPKSLKGLSLLYQDGPDSDLYTVATQQGMVVEECACL